MSIRFDSMVIDDLGRQTEAKVHVDCSLRTLAVSVRRQIIGSSTRLVEIFFFFSIEETRLTIYRLNRRKDYKEEIEYLREEGKLEE